METKREHHMKVSLHFQRSSDRLCLTCPIMYSGIPAIGEGLVLNLSPYGCTVETMRSVLNGSYMKLRLFMSDSHPSLRIELAAVRWVRESYFGVEFLRIPEQDRSRLDRYLNDFRIIKERLHFSNTGSAPIRVS
jgi:PilZ domain